MRQGRGLVDWLGGNLQRACNDRINFVRTFKFRASIEKFRKGRCSVMIRKGGEDDDAELNSKELLKMKRNFWYEKVRTYFSAL